MEKKKQNTFFTEEIYRTQLGLDINEDVVKKMYDENVKADDKLPIEFFFVSDNVDNVLDLQSFIKIRFSDYEKLKVGSNAVLQGVCSGYDKASSDDLMASLGTTVELRSAGVKEKK